MHGEDGDMAERGKQAQEVPGLNTKTELSTNPLNTVDTYLYVPIGGDV